MSWKPAVSRCRRNACTRAMRWRMVFCISGPRGPKQRVLCQRPASLAVVDERGQAAGSGTGGESGVAFTAERESAYLERMFALQSRRLRRTVMLAPLLLLLFAGLQSLLLGN